MGSQVGTVLASLRVHRDLAKKQEVYQSLTLLSRRAAATIGAKSTSKKLLPTETSLRYKLLNELPESCRSKTKKNTLSGQIPSRAEMPRLLDRLRKRVRSSTRCDSDKGGISYIDITSELFRVTHHKDPIFNPTILLSDGICPLGAKSEDDKSFEAKTVRLAKISLEKQQGQGDRPIKKLPVAPSDLSEIPPLAIKHKPELVSDVFQKGILFKNESKVKTGTILNHIPEPYESSESGTSGEKESSNQCSAEEEKLFLRLIR